MKIKRKHLMLSFLVFGLFSCQKNANSKDLDLNLPDTLIVSTKKVKGEGLFTLGYGYPIFKDTTEVFSQDITYPKGIDNLKRFQFRVDFKTNDSVAVEMLLGKNSDETVYIVDQNNNRDLTDDTIRPFISNVENALTEPISFSYDRMMGKTIAKDTSWLKFGESRERPSLGRREHLVATIELNNTEYKIGIIDLFNPLKMTYNVEPEMAVISEANDFKDALSYGDKIKLGEYLILDQHTYRFDSISKYGEVITLVREDDFNSKIGTQKGMLAPDFKVITTAGDTINSKGFKNKLTVVANSCGCGGDKTSTHAFYDMESRFGKDAIILRVDSKIDTTDGGIHINVENPSNQDFYSKYRKVYCSRICYVIGTNGRIIDKFRIFDWKSYLPQIIKEYQSN